MTSLRLQAFAAEDLSALLIDTYQNKQSHQMVQDFSSVGFTRSSLYQSHEQVYLMIVTASYDRRPFTGAAGGYEYIWGIKDKDRSLPARLIAMGLSDPSKVSRYSLDEIKRRLAKERIRDYALDSIESVDYAKSLLNAATSSESLHRMLNQAKSAKDSSNIYNELIKIHGIGETIAAKLVKYMLREIGVGNIDADDFPLSVVWPLVAEYHNEQAIAKIKILGSDVAPLTMGLLIRKGDPFAIDALFYLNRYEPRVLDEFVADIKQWVGAGRRYYTKSKTTYQPDLNVEKAKILLGIINDVCVDIEGLTKQALQGLGSPQKVKAAATRLYGNMAAYASRGDINQMHQYYQNCLKAPSGMEWDWLLEKIGRKSLRSEWERFNAIYNDKNNN